MSFTPLNHEFRHVRDLPNQPRFSDGYTPEIIKETFDRAGEVVKNFLNEVLLPALENQTAGESAAESIGSAAIGDLPAGTLHAQLTKLKEARDALEQELHDAAAGIFPPESITEALLAKELSDALQEARAKNARLAAFTTPGEHSFTVPQSGLYRLRMCGGGSAGSLYHPHLLDGKTVEGSCYYEGHGGGAGASLEALLPLKKGDVYQITVGAGGIHADITESPAETLNPGYDIADIQAHLNQEEWIRCGDETRFSNSNGTALFSCAGGDPRQKRVYCSASEFPGAVVLTQAGESKIFGECEPIEGELARTSLGASSALGQGGEYVLSEDAAYSPGYGGGGHGGLLYLTTPHFDLIRAAGDGGCGAVLLEYIQ